MQLETLPSANDAPQPETATLAATLLPPAARPAAPVGDTRGASTLPTTEGVPIPDAAPSSATPFPRARDDATSDVLARGGSLVSAPTTTIGCSTTSDASSSWAALRIYAEVFEDAQKARIAFDNKVSAGNIDADFTAHVRDHLERVEKVAAKCMRGELRRVAPACYQWTKQTRGVGDHLIAHLLGVIGHPVIARPHHWEGTGSDRVLIADPPFLRNVAKLWAYCGHGDATRKRRTGMSAGEAAAMGNPRAKVVVHQLAVAQRNSRGAYRDIYDDEKARHLAAGLTKGHAEMRAYRRIGKEILRDLWVVAHDDMPTLGEVVQ